MNGHFIHNPEDVYKVKYIFHDGRIVNKKLHRCGGSIYTMAIENHGREKVRELAKIIINNTVCFDSILQKYYKSGVRLEIKWEEGLEDFTSAFAQARDGKYERGYIGKTNGTTPSYILLLKSNSYGGSLIKSNWVESFKELIKTRR